MVSRAQMYVVIPAYNEGPVISRVVSEVKRASYALVVVDSHQNVVVAFVLDQLPLRFRHQV